MTARNAPPVEVPVCNYEEQLILRVPLHIAEELRKMIAEAEESKKKQFPQRVAFALNSVPHGGASFALGDKKYEATLVNLPCLVESLKTMDKVNYYKSADIGQMLIVHDTEKGSSKPKKVHTDKDGTVSSGLVPAFKGIKRRFRQGHLSVEQVKEVEHELSRVRGGGPTDNVDIEVVEEEGEAYDVNAMREGESVEIKKIVINGTPTKEKTPRKRKPTKKRKTEESLNFGDSEFDFAAQLESEMVGTISTPTLSSSSGDGPANPFAESERPFVSIFPAPSETLDEFSLSKSPPQSQPSPPSASLPMPTSATVPPTLQSPQQQPQPTPKQPPTGSPPAQPKPPAQPTAPKPVQKQPPSQPISAPSPTPTPTPFPPAQPLFPTPLESVFSPPAIQTPLVSYLTNPQYLELSGQETALMNEIKALNATLDERKTQYNRASNAIVKSRFEQQVQKLQEQVAAKQKVLAEIVAKMEVLRNS